MVHITIKRLLREPLLHFLLIGVGLFLLYSQVGDPETGIDHRIVVTEADIERLGSLWERRWSRPPTGKERDRLIEDYIREEILYREALALGLEQDDTIVRRRMAQKMEFLFKDYAGQSEPTEDELQAFLDANADQFTESRRYTFTHVYLNRDRRGESVEKEAEQLLRHLRKQSGPVDAAQIGDRFMFQHHFNKQSEDQIARMFGTVFSTRLADLETGTWEGPVDSGYGVHLVYISHRTEPRLPDLAEIRDRVRTELMASRQREAEEAFYQQLRQRYEIVVKRQSEHPSGSAVAGPLR